MNGAATAHDIVTGDGGSSNPDSASSEGSPAQVSHAPCSHTESRLSETRFTELRKEGQAVQRSLAEHVADDLVQMRQPGSLVEEAHIVGDGLVRKCLDAPHVLQWSPNDRRLNAVRRAALATAFDGCKRPIISRTSAAPG